MATCLEGGSRGIVLTCHGSGTAGISPGEKYSSDDLNGREVHDEWGEACPRSHDGTPPAPGAKPAERRRNSSASSRWSRRSLSLLLGVCRPTHDVYPSAMTGFNLHTRRKTWLQRSSTDASRWRPRGAVSAARYRRADVTRYVTKSPLTGIQLVEAHKCLKEIGSSGWIRTSNPPVNSHFFQSRWGPSGTTRADFIGGAHRPETTPRDSSQRQIVPNLSPRSGQF
jgi:hypothetical protein